MDIYWLWLAALKGVGPVTLRYLVMRLGSPQAVYTATQAQLEATEGLRSRVVEVILESRSLDQAKRKEELMLRQEIKLLTFVDPLYPPRVNDFANQPAVLYYKGTLRPAQASVGIVGSRRCTAYGKQVAAEAAAFLAQQGITVVSGLAKGIDSYAHTAPETQISSPQEQAILERLFSNSSENPVAIRDLLDLVDGNLKELLTLLCSMELEGKVIILGQTVRHF